MPLPPAFDRPPEAASPAPWLRVRGWGVRAGTQDLLADVSFDLRPGELVALVGANGAGKSTLVRSLAGLVDGRAGTIELAGRPLGTYPPRALAREVCYVAQPPPRLPPFTVREFVRLARYAHDAPPATTAAGREVGVSRDARARAPERNGAVAAADAEAMRAHARGDRDAVGDALALTGLEALADHRMTTLSGGERQMATVAAALAQEARLLLLDEPAAFLDVRHQEAMLALLARLNRERGQTCLVVTHDINAALLASRRALALAGGRLVYDGPAEGLADGGTLARVYGHAFAFVTHPVTGQRTVAAVGAEASALLRMPPPFEPR